ncbi:hypothetical protein HCN44_004080 [Aphidius gifuensis]|uniref:Uncharacterized protein n=1 Tax=Aphidius gifuensis TaxID=684658 RepID=A0A835CUR5_APHGI|nr:hypothetical protein HCN44_004080 [Aphidius gifuensis]
MDPAIKAVAMIAPVLAPLAVKLIDKLIFIEPPQQQQQQQQQQIQGSQIIKISTPQQCNCQKNRSKSVTSDTFDDSSATCSTCSTCFSSTGCSEMSGDYKYVSNKSSYLMAPMQKNRSSSISGKSSLSVGK